MGLSDLSPATAHHTVVGALAIVALAACYVEEVPVPGPVQVGEAQVTVAVATAAPGDMIPVRAEGFRPHSNVQIGFGQPDSDFSVVAEIEADAEGRADTLIEVPDWAMSGHPYVVVVDAPGHEIRAVSDPFVVAAGGDTVQIHGTVTAEGVECPAVRDRAGTLYTLTGADRELRPGTEVMIEGRVAEVSICMQGTTIEVESIERR
jgi:hypothetical protein